MHINLNTLFILLICYWGRLRCVKTMIFPPHSSFGMFWLLQRHSFRETLLSFRKVFILLRVDTSLWGLSWIFFLGKPWLGVIFRVIWPREGLGRVGWFSTGLLFETLLGLEFERAIWSHILFIMFWKCSSRCLFSSCCWTMTTMLLSN